MSAPLHGFPTGLLSLVGSQSFGTAPKLLGDVVAPIVDVGELYLANKQEVPAVSTFNFANGPNLANALQVPVGEIWLVRAVSIFCAAGAGGAARVTPNATYQGTGLAIGPEVRFAATESAFAIATIGPFWLTAGALLNVFATGIAATPTGSLAALISRLRA